MIQRVSPSDEPFTKIYVADEEVLITPKESNWKIEHVFFDYYEELCDEIVVVLKRKEK